MPYFPLTGKISYHDFIGHQKHLIFLAPFKIPLSNFTRNTAFITLFLISRNAGEAGGGVEGMIRDWFVSKRERERK